ncbi:Histone-lysine N-methyltransferase SETMAR [Eumeta japonica]|uniref:Histone-lysine N-methyltransferase SETMAR n=1 Tax=Eumeta variegata TaxID=151549 RepID=A0A4C1Z1E5_EUMVA|nr:Histone-lysine N-methyltransferase SETMAR [Eumeta japonica]
MESGFPSSIPSRSCNHRLLIKGCDPIPAKIADSARLTFPFRNTRILTCAKFKMAYNKFETSVRQNINLGLYCHQMMRLKQEIERKRPELFNRKGVLFHHDDARPHTSLATQQILREFGWEVIVHPPHSPDLAPSDFHHIKRGPSKLFVAAPSVTVDASRVVKVCGVRHFHAGFPREVKFSRGFTVTIAR